MPELVLPPSGIPSRMLDSFMDDPTDLGPSIIMPLARSQVICSKQNHCFQERGQPDVIASPGMAWGDCISEDWCERQPGHGLSYNHADAEHGLIGLCKNGLPLGEIYVIRETAEGLALAFPATSQPWYTRVVHRDDVALLFGTVINPLLLARAKTVQGFLEHCISHDELAIEVKHVIRLV